VYPVLLRHATPRHPPYALIHFCTCDTEKLLLSRYFACIRLLSCVRGKPRRLPASLTCIHPPTFTPAILPHTKTARHTVQAVYHTTIRMYLKDYSVWGTTISLFK
jgi:hypothetical protein